MGIVRVYVASITGNTEIKKQTQRILMVLDGLSIDYDAIDITEPGRGDDKEFMKNNSCPRTGCPVPLPPQIFNDQDYCGDFDAFNNAVEDNQLRAFLKLEELKAAIQNGEKREAEEHDVNATVENGVEEDEIESENVQEDEAAEGGSGDDENENTTEQEGDDEGTDEKEEDEEGEGGTQDDEEGGEDEDEGEEEKKEGEETEEKREEEETGEKEGSEGEEKEQLSDADQEEELDVEDVDIEDDETGQE